MSRTVPVNEAAKILGVPADTVRKRLNRKTLDGVRDNRGHWLVCLDESLFEQDKTGHVRESIPDGHPGHVRDNPISEVIPMSLHREVVGTLTDALDRQERQHQAALDRMERQHGDELARLQAAHRAGIDTLMARVAGMLVERRERRPWWRWW